VNDKFCFHLHAGTKDKRMELSWTQRLKIVTSVAEGIFYLHVRSNRDIIHRDLKPANILLADDFTPKIADFGLAKHVPDQTALHTRVGNL
jgi:serine/threonine protein kinase